MMMPPIVGVPLFFKWLCGPSVRICCPNFNRLNNGMNSGPNKTASMKETPNDNKMTIMSIHSPLFQSFDNLLHLHTSRTLDQHKVLRLYTGQKPSN